MKCPHCDLSIDEHEVGRDTDICVAATVMEWEPPDGAVWGDISFSPSTDIAAAWKVIEKLCTWERDDNMLTLKGQGPTPEHPDEQNGWYDAEIAGAAGKWESLNADTAPLAICRVALRVVHETQAA